MRLRAAAAVAAKDIKLFLRDRRALLFTLAAPIAIATFFGFLFSGNGSSERTKIPVLAADEDRSEVSRALVKGLAGDEALEVRAATAFEAREAVRKGKATVGLVVPKGFGDAAAKALFRGGAKPELDLLYDPSHWGEMGMVRGLLTQHAMEAVTQAAFNGEAGRRAIGDALASAESSTALEPGDRKALTDMLRGVATWQDRIQAEPHGEAAQAGGLSIPFQAKEEAVTSGTGVAYNGYAHSFAGMGIQWILFTAIELGAGILLERQRGLWKRLRSAPLSRFTLLLGKAAGGTATALFCLAGTFGFALLFLEVRIHGSVAGFLALCLASSLMAAAFGLMIAALGRTVAATRGLSVLAVLLLTMLGGGWVPSFLFPAWMQKLTLAIPTRWAVDGLDGVTWRGLGLGYALAPAGVLLLFTALFGAVALWKFRWEEE
jgi:ABC-2 type transport system permease protein